MILITETKSNYLNKNIPYLSNAVIYEYDMNSGGFSILRSKKVFSKEVEEKLLNMDKLKRNIYIGKLMRKDSRISEIVIEGFKEYLTKFCKLNDIEDKDILSIKKDAIFIINKKCKHLKINDYVSLKEANKYTSYLYVNEIEFYNNIMKMDVKGLSDEIVESNAFIGEIRKIMKLLEKNNEMYLFRHLRKLQKDYLNKDMDKEVYKELNRNNSYVIEMFSSKFHYNDVDDDLVEKLFIDYNYFAYINPIVRMLV